MIYNIWRLAREEPAQIHTFPKVDLIDANILNQSSYWTLGTLSFLFCLPFFDLVFGETLLPDLRILETFQVRNNAKCRRRGKKSCCDAHQSCLRRRNRCFHGFSPRKCYLVIQESEAECTVRTLTTQTNK